MNIFESAAYKRNNSEVADMIGRSMVNEVAGSYPAVIDTLADSLTPRGIGQYLAAGNRNLDGRTPYKALQAGDIGAVHMAVQSFVNGDYL